jgi:hypothetical protein
MFSVIFKLCFYQNFKEKKIAEILLACSSKKICAENFFGLQEKLVCMKFHMYAEKLWHTGAKPQTLCNEYLS